MVPVIEARGGASVSAVVKRLQLSTPTDPAPG